MPPSWEGSLALTWKMLQPMLVICAQDGVPSQEPITLIGSGLYMEISNWWNVKSIVMWGEPAPNESHSGSFFGSAEISQACPFYCSFAML